MARGRAAKRTAMIQAVHAEARRRGIDDDARAAIQRAVTGVDSCALMTVRRLGDVLNALKGRRGHLSVVAGEPGGSREKMLLKIRALQRTAGVTDAYVNGISRRMYKRAIEQCDPTQLRGVIAALDRHIKRQAS